MIPTVFQENRLKSPLATILRCADARKACIAGQAEMMSMLSKASADAGAWEQLTVLSSKRVKTRC